jgi:SAM-dependent methyltransferase
MRTHAIKPHNLRAAATWNAGGAAYDRISATIADSIEHCVLRLEPQPGQRILDVATGTGWGARRLAARGAEVVGVDFGADLIEAARAMAAEAGPEIDFRVADAEQLPFEDHSFDAVMSTYGVMFVRDPEAAAAELARVCRPGGRIGLTTWPADGTVAGIFTVMKPYQLLGGAFTLRFETGTTVLYAPDGAAVWELLVTGYGPTNMLAARLNPERRECLKRDLIAYHERFATELGVAMPREYLLTIGVRT